MTDGDCLLAAVVAGSAPAAVLADWLCERATENVLGFASSAVGVPHTFSYFAVWVRCGSGAIVVGLRMNCAGYNRVVDATATAVADAITDAVQAL